MTNLSDTTNSACDLHIPHKNVIAALTLGTIDEATASKWMEENFLEVERWVRFVRLNDCFASLPHSACCLVYNGAVDSYSIDSTVDAQAAGWTASFVVAQARIWVQNNTGGSGLVELDGAFTIGGSDQTGTSSSLLRLTIPDGEGLLLADHCTISSASDIGYHVTNIGTTNVDVIVNITVTEVDETGAAGVVLHPDPGVSDDEPSGPPVRRGVDDRRNIVRVDGSVVDQAACRTREGGGGKATVEPDEPDPALNLQEVLLHPLRGGRFVDGAERQRGDHVLVGDVQVARRVLEIGDRHQVSSARPTRDETLYSPS